MADATATSELSAREIVGSLAPPHLVRVDRTGSARSHPCRWCKGLALLDADGRRFLDFNSQLMCVNIGHGDERVIRAIQEQAATLTYVNPQMATAPRARLGAKLAEIAPGDINVFLHHRRFRGGRERHQAGAALHRPPQNHGPLSLLSRGNKRQHDADW